MTETVFMTRTELARLARLDPRNKRLEAFKPDAVLELGSKKIPLYKRGPVLLARLSLRPQLAQAVEKVTIGSASMTTQPT
jgi:hypothetical protein